MCPTTTHIACSTNLLRRICSSQRQNGKNVFIVNISPMSWRGQRALTAFCLHQRESSRDMGCGRGAVLRAMMPIASTFHFLGQKSWENLINSLQRREGFVFDSLSDDFVEFCPPQFHILMKMLFFVYCRKKASSRKKNEAASETLYVTKLPKCRMRTRQSDDYTLKDFLQTILICRSQTNFMVKASVLSIVPFGPRLSKAERNFHSTALSSRWVVNITTNLSEQQYAGNSHQRTSTFCYNNSEKNNVIRWVSNGLGWKLHPISTNTTVLFFLIERKSSGT